MVARRSAWVLRPETNPESSSIFSHALSYREIEAALLLDLPP
jgi:hypothetical protein